MNKWIDGQISRNAVYWVPPYVSLLSKISKSRSSLGTGLILGFLEVLRRSGGNGVSLVLLWRHDRVTRTWFKAAQDPWWMRFLGLLRGWKGSASSGISAARLGSSQPGGKHPDPTLPWQGRHRRDLVFPGFLLSFHFPLPTSWKVLSVPCPGHFCEHFLSVESLLLL